MTLEDETSFLNLIIWPNICRKYSFLIKMVSFIGTTGILQIQHEVVHLIVKQFWEPKLTIPSIQSRNFH